MIMYHTPKSTDDDPKLTSEALYFISDVKEHDADFVHVAMVST